MCFYSGINNINCQRGLLPGVYRILICYFSCLFSFLAAVPFKEASQNLSRLSFAHCLSVDKDSFFLKKVGNPSNSIHNIFGNTGGTLVSMGIHSLTPTWILKIADKGISNFQPFNSSSKGLLRASKWDIEVKKGVSRHFYVFSGFPGHQNALKGIKLSWMPGAQLWSSSEDSGGSELGPMSVRDARSVDSKSTINRHPFIEDFLTSTFYNCYH